MKPTWRKLGSNQKAVLICFNLHEFQELFHEYVGICLYNREASAYSAEIVKKV